MNTWFFEADYFTACNCDWGCPCNFNARPTEALEQIGRGKAGGGIFALFGEELVTEWLDTKFAAIKFEMQDGADRVEIEGYGAATSELLAYPDGTIIRPVEELPHGIEFKRGLMTDAKSWWWRDEKLLAGYEHKYGAVAKVRFTQDGCVG